MARKVPRWKIEQMRREDEAAQRREQAADQPQKPAPEQPAEQYPPAYTPPVQQLPEPPRPPDQKATVSCPACGSMNVPTATNCWACNYELAPQAAPEPLGPAFRPDQVAFAAGAIAAPGWAQPTIYAGFWLRLVASLIDSMVMLIPVTIISFGVGFFVFFLVEAGGTADDEAVEMLAGVLAQLVSLVSGWLYYALMESSRYQATLGKMALGIIVTDIKGNRLNFSRATGRYFGKIVSALICYVGFFMAGFTEKKQALHDLLASTLVVMKPPY